MGDSEKNAEYSQELVLNKKPHWFLELIISRSK